MTLKEAIESGKPFRHKSWRNGLWSDRLVNHEGKVYVTTEEAVSEDWVIQEKQTFSREDVQHAIDVALRAYKKTCSHESAMLEAMKAADRDCASKRTLKEVSSEGLKQKLSMDHGCDFI